jgi:hypothetical protein
VCGHSSSPSNSTAHRLSSDLGLNIGATCIVSMDGSVSIRLVGGLSMRMVAVVLLGITLSSILGCVVTEERRCRYGWVPEHRDAYGRLVGGHCR